MNARILHRQSDEMNKERESDDLPFARLTIVNLKVNEDEQMRTGSAKLTPAQKKTAVSGG